ncbi:alpha/beta hydrolase [Paraburkholderia sp.]|uniref:alpha/beta fold hydrolase n=1 Tax=Paraburkholderia sp. TaxID=1926495 RepID=UPI00238CECB6|nr:alpha/beta hydrolase [Paraburkholderia sp.]MDE1180444.1 alpha/beta hydrolase [Paraburkholderia sp.]
MKTSHGSIAVRESGGRGVPVILIHGNSSAGAIFRNQLEGSLGDTWRLIAPDLPGHGNSSDALDPVRSYSMDGYADAMTEVLERLEIRQAVVFGWSLGGHIGLEMISRFPGMLGLMITGTPPVDAENVGNAFIASGDLGLAGQEHFSAADVQAYGKSTCGEPFEPFLFDAVARTDGRARRLMFESFAAGKGANQALIAANATLPLAVVNGIDEPFVNLDFMSGVKIGNLWRGEKLTIERSGHAPFWDRPDAFDPLLAAFITDVSKPA